MKYHVGQQIKVIAGRFVGDRGTITRVDETDPYLTYRIDFENGRIQWYSEAMISLDELQQLRAENELLKAKYSNFITQLAVLSSNIKDSQHAFYRLEQIRLLLIEVQQ